MDLKRLLFAAPMWSGSSCIPRMKGLEALGLDVTVLDTASLQYGRSRIANSMAQRFHLTPRVWKMNIALLDMAGQSSPDVTWIDKGTWVYPSTLRRLRKYSRFIVHHHTDDIFGSSSFWLHRLGLHLYDLHMTTNRWNVLEMRRRDGLKIFRVGMGYDQDFHIPPARNDAWKERYDVVFIGHWEPHSESHMSALIKSGVDVRVWGHNWRKSSDPSLRSVKPLSHADYVETIASARIALCFLSRQNRNESTGRSFEIPSIGTFLLAQRTEEHEYLYGDGAGAAFFGDEAELVEKARHYLSNDEERRAVASAGHSRCGLLGLSWGDHMRREWPMVEEFLCRGRMPESGKEDSPFWLGFRDGRPPPVGCPECRRESSSVFARS